MAKIFRLEDIEACKLIKVGDIIQDHTGKYLMVTHIGETPGPLNSKTVDFLSAEDLKADIDQLMETAMSERWYEWLDIIDVIINRLTKMRDETREALKSLEADKVKKK